MCAISADKKYNSDKNYYSAVKRCFCDVINYRQLFRAANCIMYVRRIELPKNGEKCTPRGQRDGKIYREIYE